MDHYKTLGLSRDATKDEIKESFRRSALNFHPDRHVQSSEVVRQRAVLRFKQASEAYEVLVDDRKRADYDFSLRRGGGFSGWSGGVSPAASAGYAGRGYGGGGGSGGGGYPRRSPGGGGLGLDVEFLFKLMTTRGFLLSLAFASLLLGGAAVAERSVDTLWKLNNTGVIFTEENKSLLHFLTSICAIIGGVFTVAGILDSFIYHGQRAIKKKQELGKYR